MAIIRGYCEISSDMADKFRKYGSGEGDDLRVCQLWFLDGRTALDPWDFVGINPAVTFPNSTTDCKMLVYSEATPAFTVYGLPSYPRFKTTVTVDHRWEFSCCLLLTNI